ncbi:MAG: hypothetical protein ACI4SQ_01150 [Eubacterium sp.]
MDWKTPKSVRQIGDVKGKCKIYVEDYVITFAKRMVKEAEGKEAAGVLLGHRLFRSHERLFQVSGMVVIHDFANRKGDSFSSEMWTDIYTDMKENFSDVDVVGWFYTGTKAEKGKAQQELLELHRRNFSDGDKLFLCSEPHEWQETCFQYENSMLVPQTGYYVYYEKNPEMRRYMMEEANRFVHIVEQEDDRVLRNIRGVMQEKEEKKKDRELGERRNYGFAALVVLLAVVFAAAAWNNKATLTRLNDQMTGIKNEIKKELNTDTTMETIGNSVVTPQAVATQVPEQGVPAANVSPAGVP